MTVVFRYKKKSVIARSKATRQSLSNYPITNRLPRYARNDICFSFNQGIPGFQRYCYDKFIGKCIRRKGLEIITDCDSLQKIIMVSDPIKNSRQPLPNYNANSQSESRRKFLGILAAGVASIAMPNFALAGSNFSELPPGYQSKLCDDEMLQIAFAIMYRVKRYRGTNEQVKSMLIDNGVNFYGFPKIDFKNTPLKEPGYWFLKLILTP